jgi:hypothetical protein
VIHFVLNCFFQTIKIISNLISIFRSGIPLHVMQNDYKLVEEWQRQIAPHCDCPMPKCNTKYPYRTADGGCNNFHFPTWGQAMRAQQRWLPARYSDGKKRILYQLCYKTAHFKNSTSIY